MGRYVVPWNLIHHQSRQSLVFEIFWQADGSLCLPISSFGSPEWYYKSLSGAFFGLSFMTCRMLALILFPWNCQTNGRKSISALEQEIDPIPEELEGLFEFLLQSIGKPARKKAYQMFGMLLKLQLYWLKLTYYPTLSWRTTKVTQDSLCEQPSRTLIWATPLQKAGDI